MELLGRSLYNLIQINLKPDAESTLIDGRKLESWQSDNYREKSLEQLIQGLQQLNLPIDLTQYEQLAKTYDTPEELDDLITSGQKPLIKEKAYLYIFELWRRLCPEKQSLSIFCDELDHQIILYDKGETLSPTDIHDILAALLKILDENVDQGLIPENAFKSIQNYTANDLESFLYDYIFEEIETENFTYAEELLEDFTRYMKDKKWFNLLSIYLESLRDPSAGTLKLKELLEKIKLNPQLNFNLEVLHFLARGGDRHLFYHLAGETLKLIKTEEDLEDFLVIAAAFFHSIDYEDKEHLIQNLMMKRSERIKGELNPSDADLISLKKLFKEENQEKHLHV